MVFLILSVAAAAAAVPEHQVKAEFLERFTHFVDWPPEALGAPGQPFVIAVVGSDPFGPYLEEMARTRKIKDRPISLRRVTELSELSGVHLVFIDRSARDLLPAVLDRTHARPVLTVGDTAGFARAGVLINFYLERGSVHFEINRAAARRSGLSFSARLLELGRSVR